MFLDEFTENLPNPESVFIPWAKKSYLPSRAPLSEHRAQLLHSVSPGTQTAFPDDFTA